MYDSIIVKKRYISSICLFLLYFVLFSVLVISSFLFTCYYINDEIIGNVGTYVLLPIIFVIDLFIIIFFKTRYIIVDIPFTVEFGVHSFKISYDKYIDFKTGKEYSMNYIVKYKDIRRITLEYNNEINLLCNCYIEMYPIIDSNNSISRIKSKRIKNHTICLSIYEDKNNLEDLYKILNLISFRSNKFIREVR